VQCVRARGMTDPRVSMTFCMAPSKRVGQLHLKRSRTQSLPKTHMWHQLRRHMHTMHTMQPLAHLVLVCLPRRSRTDSSSENKGIRTMKITAASKNS
jgi:hypothetical protein